MSHSAIVILRLACNGQTYSLSHVGSEFVVAREPCTLPKGAEGDLLISIDGNERAVRVSFPDGVRAGERAVYAVVVECT